MSNTKYTFKHASLTDVGLVRQLNEDRELVVRINPDCIAYIVCDGMGGHDSGDKASEAAVRFISEYLTTKPIDNASIALANAIKFANQQIYFESKVSPTSKGMGTTAVVMLQYQDEIHVGHIGDSRAYRFLDNKLTQITKDHSVVQDMVDQGLISQSQSEHHPRKNEITKALGIRETEEPTISKNIKAVKGERIVLCSDGLSGLISHEVFTKTLQTIADPMACALQLIKLAKQGGGHDNITVQIIDVLESPHKQVKETKSNQTLMLSIAAVFVGIFVVTFALRESIIEIITGPRPESSLKTSTKDGENSGPVSLGTDNSDKIDLDEYVSKETLIRLLKFTKNESGYLEIISKKQIDMLKSTDINLLSYYKITGEDTIYKLSDFFKGKIKKKIEFPHPTYFFSNPEPTLYNGKTGDRKTGDRKTGDRKTGDRKTGDSKTGDSKTGDSKTGDSKTGDSKTGDSKTGDSKTGDSKTGDSKTGDSKTGDGKTSDGKTSDSKTGDSKTGDSKTGDSKTGDSKTGDSKTGDSKTGDSKTGDSKTGDSKSGNGKRGNGKRGNGKTSNGKTVDGKTGDVKTSEGKTGDGKTS
ncbi:Stp1/IreP family PP2C-type Ser/Thr phosphatase [Aquirufa sp.]|jgi:serine/threonine protein phosphatase PrpC|uniref:Stp1/IreP family PP2C-type Ser/Thr phosphatase n=1 Tax=Aquirufa sp. TaxID=2676249 RepID=UPI0037C05ADA